MKRTSTALIRLGKGKERERVIDFYVFVVASFLVHSWPFVFDLVNSSIKLNGQKYENPLFGCLVS